MTIVAGALGALWVTRTGPAAPLSTFAVDAPSGAAFNFLITATAVSPDGRFLVFRAGSGERAPVLWLRPIDSVEARPLPGTEGADFPFWSPDSRSIAFFAGDQLKRLDLAGGAPLVLAEAVGGRTSWGVGGTWNRDGVILFGETRGLIRIAASGGTPEAPALSGLPRWRPDGKELFYLAAGSRAVVAAEIRTWVDGVETATPRELFDASIPAEAGDWLYPYDIAPGGERFLIQEPAEIRSSPLTVVLNWPAKLKP